MYCLRLSPEAEDYQTKSCHDRGIKPYRTGSAYWRLEGENKIKTIIIPKANEKDLEEIPEIVKKGITFIPVSRAQEVLDIVF